MSAATVPLHQVLECLLRDEDELRVRAGEQGLDPACLGAWRSALLSIAVRELPSLIDPLNWVQADIELVDTSDGYLRLLGSPLLERIQDWSQQSSCGYYLHKPPGLKIRAEGDRQARAQELAGLCDELQATGAARSWRFGSYLPETALFGGEAGLAITHRLFTADSIAVLGYHRTRQAGATATGPAEFSLACLLALAEATIRDRWERWDAWTALGRLGRLAPERNDTAGQAALEWVLRSQHDLREGRVPAGTESLVTPVMRSVNASAADLAATAQAGQLLASPRQLLPFWAVFHWNRMGFSLAEQRELGRLLELAARPEDRRGRGR
jgi:thiopeptide-type bacteriocin biosynthesis protein